MRKCIARGAAGVLRLFRFRCEFFGIKRSIKNEDDGFTFKGLAFARLAAFIAGCLIQDESYRRLIKPVDV